MKRKLSLLTAFLIIVLTFSCGKYEKGPKFSVLPKETRLLGNWSIDKIFNDGVENTTSVDLTDTFIMNIEPKGVGTIAFWGVIADMEWKFTNDKENFSHRFKTNDVWSDWYESKILRLTIKEFWIYETSFEDGETHNTETQFVKK